VGRDTVAAEDLLEARTKTPEELIQGLSDGTLEICHSILNQPLPLVCTLLARQ